MGKRKGAGRETRERKGVRREKGTNMENDTLRLRHRGHHFP